MSSYNDGPDGVVLSSSENQHGSGLRPETEWKDLTFNELVMQKSMLYEKYNFLCEVNNPIKSHFAEYITKIDSLILAKT